jgi:hypothetical protein
MDLISSISPAITWYFKVIKSHRITYSIAKRQLTLITRSSKVLHASYLLEHHFP